MTIHSNIKIMIIIMIIMIMIGVPMTMITPDDHVVSVKGPGRETVDGQSRPTWHLHTPSDSDHHIQHHIDQHIDHKYC